VLDSGHVAAVSLTPEALLRRLQEAGSRKQEVEDGSSR